MKVDTLVSVRANGPKSVALVGERTHEVKLLRVGPWVKNRILLADLGLLLPSTLREDRGERRVVREPLRRRAPTRSSCGPTRSIEGGRSTSRGSGSAEVLPRLQREVLDAEVELAFQRRVYNGHRSGDTARFRLVAVWDESASGVPHLPHEHRSRDPERGGGGEALSRCAGRSS